MRKISKKNYHRALAIALAGTVGAGQGLSALPRNVKAAAAENSTAGAPASGLREEASSSAILSPDDPKQDPLYLSSLKPTYQRVGWAQLKTNTALDGSPIKLNLDGKRQTFASGLTAHASALLKYDISSISSERNLFVTYIGIDPRQPGEVIFRFYIDEQKVYDSGRINRDKTQRVMLPLHGGRELKIEIDEAGNKGNDHSLLADAKFVQVGELPQVPDVKKEQEDFYKEHAFFESQSPEALKALYKLRFNRAVAADIFGILVLHPEYRTVYQWLLKDSQALEMLAKTGGPAGSYARFFEVLNEIYQKDRSIRSNLFNKRLALATALEFSRTVTFWANRNAVAEPLRRYELYRDLSRTPGEMVGKMFEYDIEELRAVVSAEVSNDDLVWIREKIKKEKPEFLASPEKLSDITYQYMKYRLFNKHGDSVQGPDYYGEDPRLDRIVEYGGVCGAISKFDVVVLRAFGVPANVIGQPGHAAVTFLGTGKVWKTYNAITGWERSQGGVYSFFASAYNNKTSYRYKDSGYTTTYNQLAQAAKRQKGAYEKANTLYVLAMQSPDAARRREYLEAAIQANKLFLPAHDALIMDQLSLKLEARDEALLTYYVKRAMEDMKGYPKPLMDIAYAVKSAITSRPLQVAFYAALSQVAQASETQDPVDGYMARSVVRSKEFQELLAGGQHMLGSFSFDGVHAERLWGARTDSEYSLDGGESWQPVQQDNPLLSPSEIQQITAKNGIWLRIKGRTTVTGAAGLKEAIHLPIIQPVPPKLDVFSREKFITGLDDSMEWSVDGGQHWYRYRDVKPYLDGSDSIQVRHLRSGNKLESTAKTFTFRSKDALKDIMHLNTTPVEVSSTETDHKKEYANNGDYSNFWLSQLNGGDTEPKIVFAFDQAYTLTGLRYVPRQDGKKLGNIIKAKLEISDDKEHWTPVAELNFKYKNNREVQNWTATAEQRKKGRYVRVTAIEGGKDQVDNFALVMNMADILFQTTQDEAAKGLRERETRSSSENVSELKKGIQQADQLVTGVSQTLPEVEKKLEAAKTAATSAETGYQEKLQQIEKDFEEAKKLLAQYEEAKKQRETIAVEESKRSELQKAYVDSVKESENLARALRLVESKLNALDEKESEEAKNSAAELAKLQAADQEQARAYREAQTAILAKAQELAQAMSGQEAAEKLKTLQSLSQEELDALATAQLQLKGLPSGAQAQLTTEAEALQQVMEAKKQQDELQRAESFRQRYGKLIHAEPSDLNQKNYKSYKALYDSARQEWFSMPASTRELLADEAWHIFYPTMQADGPHDPLGETLFVPFENHEANQALRRKYMEVKAYWQQIPHDTDAQQALRDSLKDTLKAAAEVAKNKELKAADYYRSLQTIEVAYNDVKQALFKEQDHIERVNRYRQRYASLLKMDMATVGASDTALLAAALKVYDRLPDSTRESLGPEQQTLQSLLAASRLPSEKREESLDFWKAKLAAVLAQEPRSKEEVPEAFYPAIGTLYRTAKNPVADDAEAYKKLISKVEADLWVLKQKASDFTREELSFKEKHAAVLAATTESLELGQKEALEKAQEALKDIETRYSVDLDSTDFHLQQLAKRMTELEQEEQARQEEAAREAEEAAKKKAEEEAEAAKKAAEEAAAKKAEEEAEAAKKAAEEEDASKKADGENASQREAEKNPESEKGEEGEQPENPGADVDESVEHDQSPAKEKEDADVSAEAGEGSKPQENEEKPALDERPAKEEKPVVDPEKPSTENSQAPDLTEGDQAKEKEDISQPVTPEEKEKEDQGAEQNPAQENEGEKTGTDSEEGPGSDSTPAEDHKEADQDATLPNLDSEEAEKPAQDEEAVQKAKEAEAARLAEEQEKARQAAEAAQKAKEAAQLAKSDEKELEDLPSEKQAAPRALALSPVPTFSIEVPAPSEPQASAAYVPEHLQLAAAPQEAAKTEEAVKSEKTSEATTSIATAESSQTPAEMPEIGSSEQQKRSPWPYVVGALAGLAGLVGLGAYFGLKKKHR